MNVKQFLWGAVLGLGLCACSTHPDERISTKSTFVVDHVTSNLWHCTTPGGLVASVTVYAYQRSSGFEINHSRMLNSLSNQNAVISRTMMGMSSNSGLKSTNIEEFMAELEDMSPSPFDHGDWRMISAGQMWVPDTNQVWLGLSRHAPSDADVGFIVRCPEAVPGALLVEVLRSTMDELSGVAGTNPIPVVVSHSEMFDAEGKLVAPEMMALGRQIVMPGQD
jgi:hypothetical protein